MIPCSSRAFSSSRSSDEPHQRPRLHDTCLDERRSGVFLSLGLTTLLACAPTNPVTSAYHGPIDPTARTPTRFLVWSNDPNVEPLLFHWVEDHGGTVVEPARVEEVVQAQQLSLSPTPDVEETLLRLARLVQADGVLVAGVIMRSYPVYWMYSGHKEGGNRVNTLYAPTVTVRSLSVNTGAIMWSVTASGPGPVFVPERAVIELTEAALTRATCEAELGHQWQDDAGCMGKP